MKTGKTSIARAMQGLEFQDFLRSTHISSYFSFDSQSLDESKFQINVWDVGGDPVMRNLAEIYFCNIDIAIIVIEIDKYSTFENLPYWINLIKHKNPDTCPRIMIVANKIDLSDEEKKIDEEKIKEFASKNNYNLVFTSSKSGDGISELKTQITKELISIHEECMKKVHEYAKDIDNNDDFYDYMNTDENTCCILE